jgi:uncharacterized SAM-binding protein YcdF (DUF218 family)
MNARMRFRNAKPRRSLPARLVGWTLLLVLLVVAGWCFWVYRQIEYTAHIDNAERADAIAVFGAAEYRGRPSPVLHARLDKAVALYDHGIAPFVITLGGGSSKDSGRTEGGVGRDYLLANGIPFDHLIAETHTFDTQEQVKKLADIAAARHFRTIVVVSDGTHLFRIALLCHRDGLNVYTSPRAQLGHIDDVDAAERVLHEIVSYTALRMNLNIGWLRRLDNRPE